MDGELTARPLLDEDLAKAHALTVALNWPHRLDDWQQMHALGQGIACHAPTGRLAGAGLAWSWGDHTATLGLIVVPNELQRRGVGRLIVTELLAGLPGCRVALNATVAGLKLYGSMGFRRVGTVRQFQGDARRIAPRAGIRIATARDRALLVDLDACAFGAPRPRLIDFLLQYGEGAVIEDGSGAAAGFGFKRPFGRGNLVGPIAAEDVSQALALFETLLVDGFNRVDITDHAADLVPAIVASGLQAAGTVATMTRGGWPAISGGMQPYLLVSQALG